MTKLFSKMKDYTRRKMASMEILAGIDQLSQLVTKKREQLIKIVGLGNSADESKKLLEQTINLEQEVCEISEKCLKTVAACQSLDSDNVNSSLPMESSIYAYQALEKCAELQQLLETTKDELNSARHFFEAAEIVMEKLGIIVSKVSSAGDISVDDLVLQTREIVKGILEEGVLLTEKTANVTRTAGVRYEL